MTDRRESTPQEPTAPHETKTDWTELSPFRETFLQYITPPETRDALLHLGDLLFQMVLEYRIFWPDRQTGEIEAGLQATALDLVSARSSVGPGCVGFV